MLSFLGRMSYSMHLLAYPGLAGFWMFVVQPTRKRWADEAKQAEWDAMSAARPVDPDTFNPFTPVPYHNNPELNYVFSHINMRNYVNQNHVNKKDFIWASYHNSFDHVDKLT